MRFIRTLAVALLVGVGLISPQTRISGDPNFTAVRDLIRQQLLDTGTPSMAVAVTRGGRILWEEGFGLADRTKNVPATAQTMYYTGSVTKAFATTALMILQERKQIDLDRPANDYLGAAKLTSPAWDASHATLFQVATHTAGLTTFNPVEHLSADDAIRRYGVLFWPPGERFDYSNMGPIILGRVIEKVSGKKYADFLRGEVFSPLGMTHAAFGANPELEPLIARQYTIRTGLVTPVTGLDDGVFCSAHDLARFAMFQLKDHSASQKRILSEPLIDEMHNRVVSMPSGHYGLAWNVEEDRYGYRSVLAQGGTHSAQAWLRLIPSEDLGVVVLANMGSAPASPIVDEIIGQLLPSYAAKRRSADKQMGFAGQWTGFIRTLHGNVPLSLSIPNVGTVHAQLASAPALPVSESRFSAPQMSLVMKGNPDAAEVAPSAGALKLDLTLRDGILEGAAVTDPTPQLPFWTELRRSAAK